MASCVQELEGSVWRGKGMHSHSAKYSSLGSVEDPIICDWILENQP